MNRVIKFEELAMFGLSLYFFTKLTISGWWYAAFFLAPDFGMLGYLINTKVGAWTYNLTHHKAVAIGFWLVGYQLANEPLIFTGILLFGHSSFDRVFGYGLKYLDNFKHTHLGWLPDGKNKK